MIITSKGHLFPNFNFHFFIQFLFFIWITFISKVQYLSTQARSNITRLPRTIQPSDNTDYSFLTLQNSSRRISYLIFILSMAYCVSRDKIWSLLECCDSIFVLRTETHDVSNIIAMVLSFLPSLYSFPLQYVTNSSSNCSVNPVDKRP